MNDESKAKGPSSDRWGDAWAKRVARALMELDRMSSEHRGADLELRALKLKIGETDHAETTVVVTGWDAAGAPIVGFGSGSTPSEALVATINRVVNGQIKWKDDQYG